MTTALDLSAATRKVADRLAAATVSIGREARGSGMVVGTGRVLTNAHLLRDTTTSVGFADGRTAQGSVVGIDPDGDLAVLEVETSGAPTAELATDAPAPGDLVFGVGRGGGTFRVTFGVVSAAGAAFRGPRGRRIAGAVEHTAPLARGSSGGPLADAEGRVVGVNTHRGAPGFYLARPTDESVRARIAQLVAGETIGRRSLGLALAPSHVARRLRQAVGLPDRAGLLVRGVDVDGPAARAGVREGDLLVRAGGRDVADVDELHAVLDAVGAADSLAIVIVRGVDELELVVEPLA